MHLSPVLLFGASFLPSTRALPTSLDKRVGQFAEDKPWLIRNLVIFNSYSNHSTNSTVDFSAEDINAGIEMTTWCAYSALPGFNCNIDQYFRCQNSTMSFRWFGDQFWIRRTYNDPSVGTFPWGGVTNVGWVDTTSWPRRPYANGVLVFQSEINVTCSETAA